MAQDEGSEGIGVFFSYVLLGVGVGGLVYLGAKYFGAARSSGPGLGSTAASGYGVSTGPGTEGNRFSTPGHAPPVVSLLRSDPSARKVFLFQAGMFSFFQTDALPDGKVGPMTHAMIARINRALNPMDSSATFNDGILQRLGSALRTLTDTWQDLAQARVRPLPGTLPQDLINQINAEGLAIASDVPLLQITAA